MRGALLLDSNRLVNLAAGNYYYKFKIDFHSTFSHFIPSHFCRGGTPNVLGWVALCCRANVNIAFLMGQLSHKAMSSLMISLCVLKSVTYLTLVSKK